MRAGPRSSDLPVRAGLLPRFASGPVIGSVRAARRLLRRRVGGAEPHPGNRSHASGRRRSPVARPACAAPARTRPRAASPRRAPTLSTAGRHAVAGGPRVGPAGHAGGRHRGAWCWCCCWLARSCGGSSATSKNQDYFDAGEDGAGEVRRRRRCSCTTCSTRSSRSRSKQVQSRADHDRDQAQSAVTAATSLKPTKQVESLQPWLLQTLSYRVNGLDCMITGDAAGLQREAGAGRRQAAGALHAADARLRHHLHRLLLDAGAATRCRTTASTSRCRRRCSSTSPTRTC